MHQPLSERGAQALQSSAPSIWTRRRFLHLSAATTAAAVLAAGGTRSVHAQTGAEPWSAEAIPGQEGRRVLITGGNGYPQGDRSGLGYHQALNLVRAGADVIIASRNIGRGEEAVRLISEQVPGARIRFQRLDLADLSSVHEFADWMAGLGQPLDLLVNNAGVMGRLEREVSVDGFERVFATNTIGHFALTGLLLPLLRRGTEPRVVWVASSRTAPAMRFADLNQEQDYDYGFAYDQSKLANLLLAFEMNRRSAALDWGISSLAAHPGVARTNLIPDGPGLNSMEGMRFSVMGFMFPTAAEGAVPLLYAATSTQASAGGYYGPAGRGGPPGPVAPPDASLDAEAATMLWDVLEGLTGTFPA